MGVLQLLAVGGPRHGEFLPLRSGDREVSVMIVPPLKAAYRYAEDDWQRSDMTIKRGIYKPLPLADRVILVYQGEW